MDRVNQSAIKVQAMQTQLASDRTKWLLLGAVASIWGFASMGAGFGGMLFSLVTGWLVEHYSFQPTFVLFGIIPLISAWLVWTLPATEELAPALP